MRMRGFVLRGLRGLKQKKPVKSGDSKKHFQKNAEILSETHRKVRFFRTNGKYAPVTYTAEKMGHDI